MESIETGQLMSESLGSAQVFVSAVAGVMEQTLLREIARSSHVTLAEPGRKLLRRDDSAKRRKFAKTFGALDANEIRRSSELLERLTKGIVKGSGNSHEICLQCGIYLKTWCLVRRCHAIRLLVSTAHAAAPGERSCNAN